MTESKQVYKCLVCGIVVEVLDGGAGEPVCCGQPMALMKPRTEDTGREKHMPIVKQTDDGVKVTVGQVAHPMEETHYIQWIEIRQGRRLWRVELAAGDQPAARFPGVTGEVIAREFCNKHGLWEGHPQ